MNTIELVMQSDVLYVEAWQNYTKVVLSDKRIILCNESLKDRQTKLTDVFLRVHNSFIINLNKVVRYHRFGEVELEGGIMIPVARRRKSDFLQSLEVVQESIADRVFSVS